jgi:hypothetical protein
MAGRYVCALENSRMIAFDLRVEAAREQRMEGVCLSPN